MPPTEPLSPESIRRCSLVVLRGLPVAVLHGTPPDPGYEVAVVYRGGKDARLDTRCGPRLRDEWRRVVLVRRPPAVRTTPEALRDAVWHLTMAREGRHMPTRTQQEAMEVCSAAVTMIEEVPHGRDA